MQSPRHCELIVEGEQDQHVISHLLVRHGIANYRVKRNDKLVASTRPSTELLISVAGDRNAVLEQMATRLKSSDRSAVGFVLDADQDSEDVSAVQKTWHAICEKVKLAGIDFDASIKAEGCDAIDKRFGTRFGFWVMPDNLGSGALESFLYQIIKSNDPLIGFAESVTRSAKDEYSAPFRDVHFRKAHLSCWLAWQDEPGRPPGQAISHGAFDHNHELALRFVNWITRLLN